MKRRLSLLLFPILLVACATPPIVTPTSTPSPTATPSPTPTSTPEPTVTFTPIPLPYAHDMKEELRSVCGVLS